MDGPSAVSSSTALIAALGGVVAATVVPIVLALINRGGRDTPAAVAELDPNVAMPRSEYDGLLEQLSRLDDECDRLTRENNRLRERQARGGQL